MIKPLSLHYLAAAEARGANSHTFVALRGLGVHGAQIDIPAPLGDVMGMTDIVSRTRPFAANFANLCHESLQKTANIGLKPNYNGIT